jgi:SNF2 family DNA or RNA helicase
VYKELADIAQQSEGDTDPDNPLTKQLRLRQEIELMKAPIFADLATNAIEEGGAVAVFVSFRATLEKVIELLKKYMPLTLKGGDTEDERQSAVDSFGVFSRCIVCTISAGGLGISLHDEHGTFPRVSIISPSFSAIELKQALGRVHRAGAKTKSVQRIVFAANTVEEKVCSRVRQKLNNIDLINDDELNPIL